MHDFLETKSPNLEAYWVILRRRRWWLLLPFFLGWAIVFVSSWFLPAVYRSETLVLVERQRVPEQYVIPNVEVDLQERLQSMTQQIMSRTRLLRIIEEFQLYWEERLRLAPDQLVEQMRRDIRIELVRAPGRRRDHQLTAFKIAYSNRSPRLAQAVAGQLTSLFIEENLRARQQQSESTSTFLRTQLGEARKRLGEQEQRVREFKVRYLGQLPQQMQSNVQILSGLHGRIQAARTTLNQAEQQKLYLESLLAQYAAMQVGARQNKTESLGVPPALERELDRLKTRLPDLSARYTDRHPDVQNLKEQIAETEKLKQQIEAELAARSNESDAKAKPGVPAARSAELRTVPPQMQIESQLRAKQLEVENWQREIKGLEARSEEYQAQLNLTPLREQQLAGLARDYEQSKKNYESLLAKKLQSELATNLEKRQQGEQFRILDPPSLPHKPHWPNRFRLSCIGLLAGILLGLGATAVAELKDDRIYSEEELTRLVPATVLVEIPPLLTKQELRKHRWRKGLEWLAGNLMVAVMVAGNFLAYYWG